MYAYIKGTLAEKTQNYVVIDVGGIGYQIYMSSTSINKIGELDSNVKVYTHYHVREDNISLYGFLSNEELKMFELLLSVSGIGAKTAIAMLSQITPSQFALAVISSDVTALKKIPGVGPKSAGRIILELKDKLKTEQAIVTEGATEEAVISGGEDISEAIAALQMLGYRRSEIDSALNRVDVKNLKVEDIIRKALAVLGK